MGHSRETDAEILEFIYDYKRENREVPHINDIQEKFPSFGKKYSKDLQNAHLVDNISGSNGKKLRIRREGVDFFQNHNRMVQEKISSSTEFLFTVALLSGTGAQIYLSRSSFPDPIIWQSLLAGFGIVIVLALLLSLDNLLYSVNKKVVRPMGRFVARSRLGREYSS